MPSGIGLYLIYINSMALNWSETQLKKKISYFSGGFLYTAQIWANAW